MSRKTENHFSAGCFLENETGRVTLMPKRFAKTTVSTWKSFLVFQSAVAAALALEAVHVTLKLVSSPRWTDAAAAVAKVVEEAAVTAQCLGSLIVVVVVNK